MPVFVNKYENYTQKKGTMNIKQTEEDCANQSHAEKCDIKTAILKYGMIPPELIEPKEKLYLTNIDEQLTLNERLQRDEYFTDYFYNMPAKIRKEYHDNPQEFITDILINKNLEKARKHGIIDQEIYDNYIEQKNEKLKKEEQQKNEAEENIKRIRELEETIKNLQLEKEKINEVQNNV